MTMLFQREQELCMDWVGAAWGLVGAEVSWETGGLALLGPSWAAFCTDQHSCTCSLRDPVTGIADREPWMVGTLEHSTFDVFI